MNARASWVQEFWRIALLLGLAWLIGRMFDFTLPLIFLALLAYTFRNLLNQQRLADWLGDPRQDKIPIHFGLWGDIYSRIARVSRHQAQREKRLNKLLNEYTASTSALPDAAIALDSEYRIRWFNDAASRLIGLQAAKDIGQPLTNLFRAPDVIDYFQRRDYSETLQTIAPGRSDRQLEIRLTPYGDGQMLLMAQDITERMQHERMRKDFVANVSHELRTPLTVIRGFIENLQMADNLDQAAISRPLELMEQQSARMQQIIEDLLALARLENAAAPGLSIPVEVGQLMESVADEGRALSQNGPEIRVRIDSRRQLLGDEKLLRSVLSNLVVNAIHHTPEDGGIVLRWRDDGKEAILTVEDTGEGIAAEHLPRLTERFYRVDTGRSRERGGTGLGLAIVKHIVNRHDGHLEISSHLNRGSVFACRFPASRLLD